jgi:hypothetical protein
MRAVYGISSRRIRVIGGYLATHAFSALYSEPWRKRRSERSRTLRVYRHSCSHVLKPKATTRLSKRRHAVHARTHRTGTFAAKAC